MNAEKKFKILFAGWKCNASVTSIIIICIAMTTGCNRVATNRDYELDEQSFTTDYLEMVEKESRLKLPAGSRGPNMMYRGSTIDSSFIAKIEIPASSSEMLIKQISKIPEIDVIVTGSLSENVSWWNPSEKTIRIKRAYAGSREMFCQEEEKWILYLEHINM